MRRFLNALYCGSGMLAAMFLVAIAVIVLSQVALNVADALADWTTGSAIGLVIPSYAEFAGFFLAASSFLALAYALRSNAHIRVSLLLQHLGPRTRRLAELWCCAAGAVMAGYFAWYTVLLAVESWHFGDLSPGMVPVPLWLPQTAMALGLIVLTIALADSFVEVLRGGRPFDGEGNADRGEER